MIKNLLVFFKQLSILWLITWLSSTLVEWAELPIPGTVVGMVLLFGLLTAGIIKVEQVQLAADFLLKHMLFFFIPIAVGLMNWGSLFWDNGLVLAAAIVLGAALPFFAIGRLGQKLARRKHPCTSR
jgi:holin-like protein